MSKFQVSVIYWFTLLTWWLFETHLMQLDAIFISSGKNIYGWVPPSSILTFYNKGIGYGTSYSSTHSALYRLFYTTNKIQREGNTEDWRSPYSRSCTGEKSSTTRKVDYKRSYHNRVLRSNLTLSYRRFFIPVQETNYKRNQNNLSFMKEKVQTSGNFLKYNIKFFIYQVIIQPVFVIWTAMNNRFLL